MRVVTALEAKTRLGDLLERVARGEEIVITRHDKLVACIIPEGRPNLTDIQQAVDEIFALRQKMAKRRGFKPPSIKDVRDAINTGRP